MFLIRNPQYGYWFLLLLAGVIYSNTLGHGFVLDDEAVIVKNQFVQQGIGGIPDILNKDSFSGFERIGEDKSVLQGGRYRPLSLVFFAVLYALFGEQPLPFHLFNICLYIGTGLLIFYVFRYVMKDVSSGDLVSFITAVLFIAHPVHTEVVANIKSADELLALLFGLLFLWQLFLFQDRHTWRHGLWSALFLFLACLSKEGAVVLVVIGPLALWFFRALSLKAIMSSAIPAVITTVIYFLLRSQVLGDELSGTVMQDPMNNPFLQWDGGSWVVSTAEVRIATMFFVFAKYAGLMIFPFPLVHDYYPFQIPLQTFSSGGVWIGLLLFAGMVGYGFYALYKRRQEGFGLLLFLIGLLPVSNLLFPVGVFMAERFLYLPSLGFLLAIIIMLSRLIAVDRHRWLVLSALALTGLFSILTVKRNQAWKSNETLVLTDVRYAPKSAKLQNGAGTVLLNKALQEKDADRQKRLLEEAYVYLQNSNTLHPTYYDAGLALGACAYYLEKFDESANAYRKIAERHPGDQNAKTGLRYALEAYGRDKLMKGDTLSAIPVLKQAWTIYPDTTIARLLADFYRIKQFPDSSALWQSRVRGPLK